MMIDSLLADAGLFFFILWSIALAAVTVVAFGPDLIPAKAHSNSPLPRNSLPPDSTSL